MMNIWERSQTEPAFLLPRSRFTINGILLHDASSKLYFCEGTRKKRNGAITSPFGPIINLTRSDCEVATVMLIEIAHFEHNT